MPQILLIGASLDPHVRVLADHIVYLGGKPVVLDASSLENTVSLCFGRTGSRGVCLQSADHGEIDVSSFGAVWLRLKPVIPLPSWGPLESSAATFAQGEWRTVLRSFELALSSHRWINGAKAQTAISSKIKQLELATRIGFRVPETAITNSPEIVLKLLDAHKRIIYKALNSFVFPDQTGILTTEVTEQNIVGRPDAIKRAPGIYQELIEKNYELRVTIVGERVFPALVRTPSVGAAAIDWRHASFENIFEACTLDQEITHKLLSFQQQAGLRFGTYDLIIDRMGQCVFLECNPAGQFLWLENALGLPIMNAIATDLCLIADS